MTSVTVVSAESTPVGDMAEVILHRSFQPAIGMILLDEDSLTWEVTGFLHAESRTTGDDHGKLWIFQCKPVNTDKPIHKGLFKLMH